MRITVALDTLIIALNRGALRSALLPGASASAEQAEAKLIELSIDARIQRRGRSVRLVVTPHETNATAVQARKHLPSENSRSGTTPGPRPPQVLSLPCRSQGRFPAGATSWGPAAAI